ncbi:hypothetical protein GLOIN_2v1765872 [Rhizophagus irregularis DAOM 181602=DAOM 197198]|nr:hypothetical protein GLOIN_2v1765872 [Rhizophagus irregularis DAOM 181602=DAOM 197198]
MYKINGIWDGIWDMGLEWDWDLGLEWDYDKWDGINGIWDGIWVGWDMGFSQSHLYGRQVYIQTLQYYRTISICKIEQFAYFY